MNVCPGGDRPQSNQRGIETCPTGSGRAVTPTSLNRTSVGLKQGDAPRWFPGSTGLNRTSVGLKLPRGTLPARTPTPASIEPAWD